MTATPGDTVTTRPRPWPAEQWSLAYRAGSVPALITDSRGVVRQANAAATELLRRRYPDVLSQELVGLFDLPDTARLGWAALLAGSATRWQAETVVGAVADQATSVLLTGAGAVSAAGERFIVVHAQDVTALRAAEQQLEVVLHAATEGIYGLDRSARLTFINAAGAQLLGYSPEDLVGCDQHAKIHHTRPDGSVYPHEECPALLTLRDGAERTLAREALVRADGSFLPVEMTVTPLREGGASGADVLGAVVAFRDVSDRIAAVRAQRRSRRLAAANAVHQEALRFLQEAVMTPLPEITGVSMEVAFTAADPAAPTGGDLYDVLELPDGTLHLAVVDVLGKGVGATKAALTVVHTLRTLALQGVALDALVGDADDVLARLREDVVATALVGSYAPRSGTVALAGGGHPPALLLTEDDARYIDADGRGVGWPMAGSDTVARLVLPVGARLVCYTDGLIEGGGDVPAGLDTLARVAWELHRQGAGPAGFTRELVDTILRQADRRDDTLALSLRREG